MTNDKKTWRNQRLLFGSIMHWRKKHIGGQLDCHSDTSFGCRTTNNVQPHTDHFLIEQKMAQPSEFQTEVNMNMSERCSLSLLVFVVVVLLPKEDREEGRKKHVLSVCICCLTPFGPIHGSGMGAWTAIVQPRINARCSLALTFFFSLCSLSVLSHNVFLYQRFTQRAHPFARSGSLIPVPSCSEWPLCERLLAGSILCLCSRSLFSFLFRHPFPHSHR